MPTVFRGLVTNDLREFGMTLPSISTCNDDEIDLPKKQAATNQCSGPSILDAKEDQPWSG